MKRILLFYVVLIFLCLFIWQCSVCKNAKGSYEMVSKTNKVFNYDDRMVERVFFTSINWDKNSEGITEEYYDGFNIYLDSVNFGKKWPKSVEAFVFRGSVKEKIESSNIEVSNTVLGVGLFIKKRFYGDETHLKIELTLDEEPPKKLILDFDLLQTSSKGWHSRCMDAFYRL